MSVGGARSESPITTIQDVRGIRLEIEHFAGYGAKIRGVEFLAHVLAKHWIVTYLTGMALLGLLHLAIGADGTVVGLAFLIVCVSVVPAALFGARDVPALTSIAFGVSYASFAILWKLLTFEPLDIGLYSPVHSHVVALVGVSGVSLAALLSHFVWRRGPLLDERYTQDGLDFFFIIACLLLVFGIVMALAGGQANGGIRALAAKALVLFPIVMFCRNLAKGEQPLSRGVVLTVCLMPMLALATNSRQGVLIPIVAIAAVLFAFRIKVSWKVISVVAIVGVLFIGALSPAIKAVRGARTFMSADQVFSATIARITTPEGRAQMDSVRTLMSVANGPFVLKYVKGGEEIGRFVGIQPLDIFADKVDRFGPIGTGRFWQSVSEQLPAFIVPDKTVVNSPSYAFWVYGLIPWGNEHNETNTPFGDAYSFGGLRFMFFCTLTVFFLYCLMFRVFCPRLENSPLATFLFASTIYMALMGYIVPTLGTIFREFPFWIALFALVTTIRRPIIGLVSQPLRRF